MSMARIGVTALACILCYSSSTFAKPTVAEMLRFRPTQEGVAYTTPPNREVESCTVELVADGQGGTGWLLKDASGKPLRRFFDVNGDRKPDVWSYYLDGVESYREIDTQNTGKPDHFRWLNTGGMKYGIDMNKDGKIDSWKMISAEEVSQEILTAIITRDYGRMQALLITDADIKALGLPDAEVTRLADLQKKAPAKFQATVNVLTAINEKTRWMHLETGVPACIPADAAGSKYDLIKYTKASMLYESSGKPDWIQIGEMVRVGVAWRLVDAPTAGAAVVAGGGNAQGIDPELQGLLDQLRKLDQQAPQLQEGPKAIVNYHLLRSDVLEKVVAKVNPEEREQWIRQIADSLSAAAQNSGDPEAVAYKRLLSLEKQIVATVPDTPIAAYVVFRVISAENAVRLAKAAGPEVAKAQEQWLGRLSKFVGTYPTAEDAPEALMQLGMVNEFTGQEGQAKNWYALLAKNFGEHAYAGKARGAIRRLEIEGKPLELVGPMLAGGQFNIAAMRGKLVLVYYWASWNKDRCVGDFATLKLLLDTYEKRGFSLVCINLDEKPDDAISYIRRLNAPGVHLFQPGGLDGSPLATQYGVMFLPHMFMVDGEGKVITRTLQQVSGVEDELKKRLN